MIVKIPFVDRVGAAIDKIELSIFLVEVLPLLPVIAMTTGE